MLVDLQSLDVDPSNQIGQGCADDQYACNHSRGKVASKRVLGDNDSASTGDCGEENDEVTVDAVEEDDLVTNGRHELETDQEACWKDGVKMEHDADLVRLHHVVKAFSWSSTTCSAAAEDPVE